MKETDVAAFGELLGKEKDFVEGQIEDGSLCARVKDHLDSNKFFTKEDFAKYEGNSAKEVKEVYDRELLEKAKAGTLDHALFGAVKGAALEQKERELSKAHEVTEFKNFDDLLEKILKSKSGGTDDKALKAEIAKNEELKAANLTLKDEKDNAVDSVRKQFQKSFLEGKLNEAVAKIPFDMNGKTPDEQKEALANMTDIIKSVFTAKYSLATDENFEVVTVSDADGVLKHEATKDPLGVSDVLLTLTQKYGYKLQSPETGGQGGQSSQSSTNTSITTQEDLDAAIADGTIKPYSKEALEASRKIIEASKG